MLAVGCVIHLLIVSVHHGICFPSKCWADSHFNVFAIAQLLLDFCETRRQFF